jgi:hypothetical protein
MRAEWGGERELPVHNDPGLHQVRQRHPPVPVFAGGGQGGCAVAGRRVEEREATVAVAVGMPVDGYCRPSDERRAGVDEPANRRQL